MSKMNHCKLAWAASSGTHMRNAALMDMDRDSTVCVWTNRYSLQISLEDVDQGKERTDVGEIDAPMLATTMPVVAAPLQ